MVLRVLQVVTSMDRGGLETMIMNYYRAVDKTQVQFDFLVHRKKRGAYEDEIEAMGGKIYRVPRVNPFSFKYFSALNKFFKTHEYKIVHSHLDCMSAYPLKVAKKYGVPVRVAHSHNSNQVKDLKYILKLFSKRKIANEATDLFACGNEAGRWMFLTDRFTVVPNAVDSQKFAFSKEKRQKILKEFGIENKTVIGNIGRLSTQKNQGFLLEIFKEIKDINPDTELLIAGGGELEAELKSKAEELGIENSVIFTGVRSDTENLYSAMDIFVMPSLFEGLPVTMVEAQASGLNCVISSAVPEECIMTKDKVTVMPLGASAQDWAKHILSRITGGDRDTFEEIKKSGFDINSAALKLQEFYLKKAEIKD